jgi:biotin-(acetyl-CoA carboxylase) ligase
MSDDLTFPPLIYGEPATGSALEHACMRATMCCDAGLLAYRLDPSMLEAALVFAPEVPLSEAIAMLPACGVGFQNALGVLAPPEVAVHLDWSGPILVNGARCGSFRAICPETDPAAIPNWLAVGFTLPLLPDSDRPGDTPDHTSLFAEGCAEVSPPALLEAWARHTLHWITRWEDEGPRPLHNEWRGLVHGIGEEITHDGKTGTFLGLDEAFGMLLRDDTQTHLIPLTTQLEESP